MVPDLQRNHPTAARDVMRTTRARSKVERSRACAPLTKTPVWDSGVFRACAFRAKNPECYGFFWQCIKRYNKKPRFLGVWFLPIDVNGPNDGLFLGTRGYGLCHNLLLEWFQPSILNRLGNYYNQCTCRLYWNLNELHNVPNNCWIYAMWHTFYRFIHCASLLALSVHTQSLDTVLH